MIDTNTPQNNKYFWLFHFSGWGIFILINLITRQIAGIESLEQGLVSAVVVLLVNTTLCLLLRSMIHRFKLINQGGIFIWFKLVFLVVVLGFVSSFLTTWAMGYYFVLFGYTENPVFFMGLVYQNWFVTALVLGLWVVVYVVIVNVETLRLLQLNQQQMKNQLMAAELNQLLGQLNPHFLFNGLNNIRSLILEDTNRARRMLTELSELLRYSLNAPKTSLTYLAEEVEVVNSYVELAKIQYEKRLCYEEKIDPEAMRFKVPPMMIQLLVENAIRHGIDNHVGQGVLSLSIKKNKEQLHITVCNPGRLKTIKSPKQTGLGLQNIKKRLDLLYANQATLNINEFDNQVSVEIIIPVLSTSEAESI